MSGRGDPGRKRGSGRRRWSDLLALCAALVLLLTATFTTGVVSVAAGDSCGPDNSTPSPPPPSDDDDESEGDDDDDDVGSLRAAAGSTRAARGCGDDDDDDDDDDDASGALPAGPVLGQTVVVTVLSGKVLVKLPGSDVFRAPLVGEVLPVGTVIDARLGWIRVLAASGPGGALRAGSPLLADLIRGRASQAVAAGGTVASGDFSEGVFEIGQTGGLAPVTQARLVGGSFAGCPASSGSGLRSDGVRHLTRRSRVRRVWGRARGRFQTQGRYAAATTRGTEWLTEDRCDGTLIVVRVGEVTVFDHVRHRTFVVRAGEVRLIPAPAAPG